LPGSLKSSKGVVMVIALSSCWLSPPLGIAMVTSAARAHHREELQIQDPVVMPGRAEDRAFAGDNDGRCQTGWGGNTFYIGLSANALLESLPLLLLILHWTLLVLHILGQRFSLSTPRTCIQRLRMELRCRNWVDRLYL